MSEVKRYEHWNGECDAFADGDWVLYSDHLAAMEAKDREIEGLRGRVLELENALDSAVKFSNTLISRIGMGRNV